MKYTIKPEKFRVSKTVQLSNIGQQVTDKFY